MYSFRTLSHKTKLLMIKTLIVPTLTYPCAPLNTASISKTLELQRILNKALRFVYNIYYPDLTSMRELHQRAKIMPINQYIHTYSKNVWEKIENGIAADQNIFNEITNLQMDKPKVRFPSSYARSKLNTPPPVYVEPDTHHPNVVRYYNLLQ